MLLQRLLQPVEKNLTWTSDSRMAVLDLEGPVTEHLP